MFADRTEWNLESNRLAAALAAHRLAGKPLYDLTASNPTECGFEYDKSTTQPPPRGAGCVAAAAFLHGARQVGVGGLKRRSEPEHHARKHRDSQREK